MAEVHDSLYYWYSLEKGILKKGNVHKKIFNLNSEGVPATHLSEGGGLIQPPPGKCSINGPNELKFCV